MVVMQVHLDLVMVQVVVAELQVALEQEDQALFTEVVVQELQHKLQVQQFLMLVEVEVEH